MATGSPANAPSSLPHDLPALLVEAAFGLMTWTAIATAITPTGPGITAAIAWAYTAAGASVGALGALGGWLVGRRRRWPVLLDLPVGGAVATALPLGAFGAAFGWGYPIAPGVGWASYLFQAVFGVVFVGALGAMLGAIIGMVAALPSYAVLWGLQRLKDQG